MPPQPAQHFRSSLEHRLHETHNLTHLRVRARGALLTVESGPDDDPCPHVRFRRDTVHLWFVEMPTRSNRWEKTPFRGPIDDLTDMVVQTFPWTLAPIHSE
jgi:hypothetical protein